MLANRVPDSPPRSRARAFLQGALPALLVALSLTACDTGDKPYLAFAGGGFVFNYRLATADYGFVARVERPLPEGGHVEAEFEDPAGGPPIVLRQEVAPARRSYVFQTPPLEGIRANHDYRVELRLLDAAGTVVARYRRSYQSSADQSTLPESAPVVGPGYQRAPPPEGDPSTE